MKINLNSIKDSEQWIQENYILPGYDLEKMHRKTEEEPCWVHFGAGNIFRAFQAVGWQKMLRKGIVNSGIVVAEGFDDEIIEKAYWPNDNLTISVTLKSDGSIQKEVVGSIGASYKMDSEGMLALKKVFEKESLQMASFTITEKGYALKGPDGEYLPSIKADFTDGPDNAKSYMGKIARLCLHRFSAGKYPIALVSMDNCSHNGDKLKEAIITICERWVENEKVSPEFLEYMLSDAVSFPWSMIDKITPRPDERVKEMLSATGLEDIDIIITSKGSYTAAFVNAEETEYLVIEDSFPAGRPPLEEAGIILTKKDVVDKVEKMKVCTCLNPLHTALAVFGCLLGYEHIYDEMKDPQLTKMIEKIGFEEGLPVVVDPGILNPKDFIDTVLKVRLPNPYMPDTPQRIATDTSQKLAIRFGETIKRYIKDGRSLEKLVMIPLVYAGWLRYLMGIDDEWKEMTLSPDPNLEELAGIMKNIKNLPEEKCDEQLKQVLSRTDIMGLNLTETVLEKEIITYFKELSEGPGAVRKTLKKYVEGAQ